MDVLGERFHTLTPNLSGHDKTSFWPDPETILHEREAELVERILGKTETNEVNLIVQFYGGGTALRFAPKFSGMVRSLVLM